jgi:Toastrack DUF4097
MRASLGGQQRNSRRHRMSRFVLSVLVVFIAMTGALLTAGCENYDNASCDNASRETHDDSFTVGDSARVVVKTGNGGISVTAGPGNEVQVVTTLISPEKITYSVIQDGNTITVEAKPKTGGTWGTCLTANVVVTAPTMTDVDLHTSNGAISIEGINGSGVFETSNGAFNIFDVKGDFRGATSNGAVNIDGIEGSAELTTSNGAIDVRNAVGEVDLYIRTSNGDVTIK